MAGFSHKHYVPIMRWRLAEKRALADLFLHQGTDTALLTPLIELIPGNLNPGKKMRSETECLRTIADDIVQYWDDPPIFVDLHYVENLARSGFRETDTNLLQRFGDEARARHLTIIPVCRLNRHTDYYKTICNMIQQDCHGMCIRLLLKDFTDEDLSGKLQQLLSLCGVGPYETDLIVDLQLLCENSPTIRQIASTIPRLFDWRTFTIAGGSFPPDLSDLEKNSQHVLPRTEWTRWYTQVNDSALPRRPSYGDYVIQHPIYREPPIFPNTSASIRYTSENEWVIMRGESVKNPDGPGYRGYLGNAMLLVDRSEFCGKCFSCGDKYIYDKSSQAQVSGDSTDGPGTAGTWLQAGINHHITYVLHQLANCLDS